VPHVVVINLGTNDFSDYGASSYSGIVADPQAYRDTYNGLLDKIFDNYPDLLGVLCIGTDQGSGDHVCRDVVQQVVNAQQDLGRPVSYLDFLPTLSFVACDLHPSIAQHQEIAGIVNNKLNEIIDWEKITSTKEPTGRLTNRQSTKAGTRTMFVNASAAAAMLRNYDEVSLYNLNGNKVVSSKQAKTLKNSTLTRLPSGVYLVNAIDKSNKTVHQMSIGW
jgi:hypothetical protein